jgi:hypothetical protein
MTFLATIFDALYPPSSRRYWTFKNATALVVIIVIADVLFRLYVKLPAEQVAHIESPGLFRSPAFLVSYCVLLAIALWFVYKTRTRETWYHWRVLVFTLVLTGAVVGLVDLLLPLRPA